MCTDFLACPSVKPHFMNTNFDLPTLAPPPPSSSPKIERSVDLAFEKADLQYKLGEFQKALISFESAKWLALESKDFTLYFKIQNRLLYLYAETNQPDKISNAKEEIQDLALNNGLQLSSQSFYILCLCAGYRNQIPLALEYAQKSLALALDSQNKTDTCYAISALAIVYRMQGRYQEALREIYNLKVFFEVLPHFELQASSILLNGLILIDQKKYNEAIEVLWEAYDMLKNYKSFIFPIQLMGLLAKAHRKLGQTDLAIVQLRIASKMTDPINMPRLYKQIELELAQLNLDTHNQYDLIFNSNLNSVTELKLGRIDFKNQFVLLDLLKLFITNPGTTFSKEYLVEHIWQQNYDPLIHDNKVYVTIKRLRKMIEPDFDKPKYIFRAKNGYFMNRSAKVLVQSNDIDLGGE